MGFELRGLKIDPPLALAPMVGLSHSALRSLVIGQGGVGLLFSEMLAAKRLPAENENVSPFLIRGANEKPLFYQLFTSDENEIEPAVERLLQLDAQGIDLNLGCPAPQLRKMGAGRFLVEKRGVVKSILGRLRKNVDIPISVKIRIGAKPDPDALADLCLFMQDNGVDMITVHARLYDEKFCRKPRWELLQNAVKRTSIPLLANGGIFTVADAKKCLDDSGAAGLMIGRGGVQKPWLFRQIAGDLFGFECGGVYADHGELYLAFVDLLNRKFRSERRLGRLKQFTHYYAMNYLFGHNFASKVQGSSSIDQAVEYAREFFSKAA